MSTSKIPPVLPRNDTFVQHPEPGILLARAANGCIRSRQRLLAWVYHEAGEYFGRKVQTERLLTPQDANDLAAEAVLEFERVMDRIRRPVRYTRRMLRNNLIRFLRRRRTQVKRESPRRDEGVPDLAEIATTPDHDSVFGSMNDQQRRHVHIALERMKSADSDTRKVMQFRLAADPMTYRDIGSILGTTETALRMRVARFCKSVRRDCERAERRRSWRSTCA